MLKFDTSWLNSRQIVQPQRRIILLVVQALLLTLASSLPAQETVDTPPTPSLGANEAAYKLATGDRIRINVFNHSKI